jgi:ABC-type molybdate transport system substrate-binding protein
LVVAAVRDSAVGRRLASEPWQRVVADPEVRVGIADPAQAPVGTRALEALRLNDAQAQDPTLRVGAVVAAKLTGRFVWPDVSKLIAPLETGEIGAAFIYESEARQYGFAFVALDPRIDGSTTTFYALAVPRNAPHPELAAALITLLLSDKGRAIASEHHLSLLTSPVTIEAP